MKVVGRADVGEQQQPGRVDGAGAGAEDHLTIGLRDDQFAVPLELDPGAPGAVQDQPPGLGGGRDGQIRPFGADRCQVGLGRAVVVGWSSGGNIALAVAARHPELFRSLVIVEAPFHGLRYADRSVLAAALRLKLTQLRGRPEPAAEAFLRFASALRSGGNAYDQAPDQLREHLRGYARQVLAEWDPHPFGVIHEHVRSRQSSVSPAP